MSDDLVERLREMAAMQAPGVMMSAVRERIEWEAANRIEELEVEVERLQHDAKRGQELELAVCMHTHFTGDPPYVGTDGLVLAIKETSERAQAAEAMADGLAVEITRCISWKTEFEPAPWDDLHRKLAAYDEWKE